MAIVIISFAVDIPNMKISEWIAFARGVAITLFGIYLYLKRR